MHAVVCEVKGMLLLNRTVAGILMPDDCVKLQSSNEAELSLGFDLGTSSGRCMRKPGIRSWHVLIKGKPVGCTCDP